MMRKIKELVEWMDRNIPPGAIQVATLLVGIVAYSFGTLSKHEVTAISNTAWALMGAMGALIGSLVIHDDRVKIKLGQQGATDTALEVAHGIRLAGICLCLHRTWWNLGIFFRDDQHNYWSLVTDHRWFAVLMVAGIMRGFHRAAAPFLRKMAGGWRFAIECGIAAIAVLSQWPA